MSSSLLRFVLRRAVQALPLLLVVSVLVFALLHAAPGGPLAVYLSNPNVRPEDIERLRRALGLDRPIWQQYWTWLAAFAQGDWGYSFSDGRLVSTRILERLPATIELAGTSLLLALALALPAGMLAAARRECRFDRVTSALSTAGVSLPAFWFGLILQIVFAVWLGWLPSSGRSSPGGGDLADRVQHLLLPAAVLAAIQAAAWSRYLRASMLDVLAEPFIASARARGMPAWRLYTRHALRPALGPALTVVMMDAALIVSGAVVTESVFAWPGLGSLFTEALARRDYTVLMALLLLGSAAVIVLNVVADTVHAMVDARVSIGS